MGDNNNNNNNKELVAVTPQKHDPAWNHCQMFKTGDKVELECRYCDKVFKGGGIHRIKEHLAGQKGNAATCLQVPQHVKLQMLESLNGVAAKKRKKQKLVEEMSGCDNQGGNVDNSDNNLPSNTCALSTEYDLIPVPEMLVHDVNVYADRQEDTSKNDGRKKRGRVRKAAGTVALSLKKGNQMVDKAIGRFFIDVGLPLDAVNSAYFQPMVDAISSLGEGATGPSYHDLRSWILKDLVHEVKSDVDECTGAWGRTGCSILVNEWNSAKGKTYVNFSVYCPEGTVFLRSVDISNAVDSADAIYECLRDTVEEVGVKNIVQVITSTEDHYVVAGNRLSETYPTVFWTPCAAHCVDLILGDIGKLPKVKMILDQAKTISRYIYMNNAVLNMMRRFTFGLDLVDLGYTRSCTDFMTLKRLVNIKHNLQSMFTSEEWMESPYSKKPEGFAVLDYVSNQSFWSECASIMSLVDPLLRLFRIVSSRKRPAMGYVFAGLYRAKETIKKELVTKEDYLVYWNIIDHRWEKLNWHPLHAAGFYFNPKFFYSLEGDAHLRIRQRVYDCVEKHVADPDIQDKIMKETACYHGCAGDFGRKMAIRARDTLLNTEWWLTYGGGCPNMARLATRILSQTCSLIHHKLNKIPLEQMHERKNCVEHQRLSDLVFVQYNMSLKQMAAGNKQQECIDPIAFENINVVDEWVMEKDLCMEVSGNPDWMAVDPPLGDVTLLGPSIDDIEALETGFSDCEIFDAMKNAGEENGDDVNMDRG